MIVKQRTQFKPDYKRRLPGEYLRRILEDRGIKIVDFARRTGRPTKTISEIIAGKVAITPETALQFEKALGEGAGFWLSLEAKHQLNEARSKDHVSAMGEDSLSWAKKFPFAEMVKLRFFNKKPNDTEIVESVLKAFGVSSIPAWNEHWQTRLDLSRFKQQGHTKIDPYGVATWLRCAELTADQIDTTPYSESAFRNLLPYIRSLTTKPWENISTELIEKCADVGVAVALVPSVAKTGLRGAAYWAKKDKAVIVLSDRMKHEENIWFSFFHEACHILEHSKKSVFIDQDDKGTGNHDIESDADQFSAETLIPMSIVRDFQLEYGRKVAKISSTDFKKFARKHSVSPGLLLMRLQHHDVIPHKTQLAKLKRKVEFTMHS